MEGRRALALMAPLLILPWLGSTWLGDFDVVRLPVGCAGTVALAAALLVRLRGGTGLAVHGRALAAISAALALWVVLGLGRALNLFDAMSQLSLATAGAIAFVFAASTRFNELPPAMALVGAGVAVCGLGQALVGAAPVATLGNSNYAGTFAAICLPLALAEALDEKSVRSKALMGGASVALAAFVIVSSSRGAQVAVLVTSLPLLVAWARAGVSRKTLAAAGGLVAGALVVGVALLGSIRSDWITRWGAIADPDYKSNRVRLDIWAGSVRMLGEWPLQGVGPGNFDKRFPAYRREGEFRAHHRDLSPKDFVMVENAHNGFIQTSVEGGAVGLALGIALLVIAARRSRSAEPGWTHWGIAAAVGAFVAANLFNSLNLFWSHSIWFWLLLGQWARRTRPAESIAGAPAIAGLAVACAVGAGGLWLGLGNLRAHDVMRETAPADPTANANAAVDANPWSWRAGWRRANLWAQQGRRAEAVDEYSRVLALQPDHAPVLVERGVTRMAAGDLAGAETDLRRAAEIVPWWWGPRLQLARLEAQRKRWEEALRHAERASELRPDDPEAALLRGAIAWELGRIDESRAAFKRCGELGWTDWRRRLPARIADDPRLED